MRSGKCIKCGCEKIIASHPPEYGHNDYEKKMAVTADQRWILPGRNCRQPRGELICLVCRQCGYAEWYALEPGTIPIGEEYQTSWLKAPGGDSAQPQDEDSAEPTADQGPGVLSSQISNWLNATPQPNDSAGGQEGQP